MIGIMMKIAMPIMTMIVPLQRTTIMMIRMRRARIITGDANDNIGRGGADAGGFNDARDYYCRKS